jgi:hypothetical protein
MGVKRGINQLTWDDFPTRKDVEGWHCRFCGKALTGRKRAWCSRPCLKEVLLRVEWRYIRRCILRRDKYRCVLCNLAASDVDHIVELIDGGPFHEWANLRSLCSPCHKAKTAFMRQARAQCKKAGASMLATYEPDSAFKRRIFGQENPAKKFPNPVLNT